MRLRAEDLRHARPLMLPAVAVVAHALSWFLPVIDDYRGWQAFRVALTPIVPYETFASGRIWYEGVLGAGSALTNVLFVAALVALAAARPTWLRASTWGLMGAAVLNLYWLAMMGDDRGELRIGYYLWVASFPVLALATHLGSHPGRK